VDNFLVDLAGAGKSVNISGFGGQFLIVKDRNLYSILKKVKAGENIDDLQLLNKKKTK
jgi:hypothetical protein